MRFSDRKVLITGAAGCLGAAVAEAFAAEGARLFLLDLDEPALKRRWGTSDHLLVTADLTDPATVRAAVEAVHDEAGSIDVLCNVAGAFAMGEPVHGLSARVWKSMIDLNAGSVLNTAEAVVPIMLAAGGGRIVNVAALAANGGVANMGAYIASKSALLRLTETMAAELGDKGIGVNAVLPGTMDTPANRAAMPDADPSSLVKPASVAEVILFLASDAARAVRGAAIPVAGTA